LALGGGSILAADKALSTDIPPEQIEGTPMPIKLSKLEKSPTKAPSVYVPSDTKLISKGKEVTSSDDFPIIGDLNYITDGEKLGSEGYYLELIDGLQWVQIDLETSSTIEAIWLWHFHSQARAYHDVIIQISDDPNFESGVTTLFNNDTDNSSGLGKGSDRPYVESRFGKLLDVNGSRFLSLV
jgi:hypothetical protein